MSSLSASRKPIEPLATHKPEDIPAVLVEKPAPEDKVKSETAHQALDQATAQVGTPERATRVAERLEQLAGGS